MNYIFHTDDTSASAVHILFVFGHLIPLVTVIWLNSNAPSPLLFGTALNKTKRYTKP